MPVKAIALALLLAAGAASPAFAHPACHGGKVWIAGFCRNPDPPHRCWHDGVWRNGSCHYPRR